MTVSEIKKRIACIDKMLDNDALIDAEFNALEGEARRLTAELAKAEQEDAIRQTKILANATKWEQEFLQSFAIGTHAITNKQADIFSRISKVPFIYNGRKYQCSGTNYRAGFSHVFVERI